MPSREFEATLLPHLDAAFNYARWLARDEAEAEDVVQDACVKALRFLPSLRGDNARAWFFAIVRNTWYSRAARRPGAAVPLDESREWADEGLSPEAQLLQQHVVVEVRSALERLPGEFREVLVLREFEGLSYKDIATVVQVPIGTVMSRLARGRERLLAALQPTALLETLP